MSIQVNPGHLGQAPATAQLNLTEKSIVQLVGRSDRPTYPRLTSHDAILIRTLAIADNLDEVMMLPQNMIFPLRTKQRPAMRRKVDKTKGKDNASSLGKRKRDQSDEYEDFEDYQN